MVLPVVGVPDEDLGDVEDAAIVDDEAAQDAGREQPVICGVACVLKSQWGSTT